MVEHEHGPTHPSRPAPEDRKATGVPCATCQRPVDPLRAARVAVFEDHFAYFCSPSCEARKPSVSASQHPDTHATRDSSEFSRAPLESHATHPLTRALTPLLDDEPEPLAAFEPLLTVEPAVEPLVTTTPPSPAPQLADPGLDLFRILLLLALLGSLLSIALNLAGDSGLALTARLLAVATGAVALGSARLTHPFGPESSHPAIVLFAPLVAVLLAVVARLLNDPRTGDWLTVTGVIVASPTIGLFLVTHFRATNEAERLALASALSVDGSRVVGDDLVRVPARDLRPGEEVVIAEGEPIPVDGTVVAGEGSVLPWRGASEVVNRKVGDHVVAGAFLRTGRLRILVSASGFERAYAALLLDPRRRADLVSGLARMPRLIAERGSVGAALVAALAAFASNLDWLEVLMVAISAQAAFFVLGLAESGPIYVTRAIRRALDRGIVFGNAEVLEQAARVTTAVFCARGTLLLGEPEVTSIDPFGNQTVRRVLELLAGAESSSNQPVATAVLRAARERGIRPDAVRSPTLQPGLGICAVASDGQSLVVGTRALMLREHIGVAMAEDKISELESLGQSVLLVALAGRLVGILGLQDGLRPGARAAVQHLLDVDVEPVLLSSDTRESSEAIARALDIEHVRTDVPNTERAEEIRRLAEGGLTVAVIGRSPSDDGPLLAAEVSVALDTAGCGSSEWHIQLASEDVRDAAFALRLAHRCRQATREASLIGLLAATLGAVGVALSLLPLFAGPLFAVVGSVVIMLRTASNRD